MKSFKYLTFILIVTSFFFNCANKEDLKVSPKNFKFIETESSLALSNGDEIIWQFNYNPDEGKPYFHPLALKDGTELTWLRPEDHPWQRALWFSWKYINKVNYWEENRETGESEGVTEIKQIQVTKNKDFSASFHLQIGCYPAGKADVLTEQLIVNVSTPDKDWDYSIDWYSVFTAVNGDAFLNRTLPPTVPDGKPWGGYAGLSVRMAKTIRDWEIKNSGGVKGDSKECNGLKARWVDISGDFRGDSDEQKSGGIAMIDHQSNLRYPTPFHVNVEHSIYAIDFRPSFLFHEPYLLKDGASLELKYRVFVHNGALNPEKIEQEFEQFSSN